VLLAERHEVEVAQFQRPVPVAQRRKKIVVLEDDAMPNTPAWLEIADAPSALHADVDVV
jgi:hypothetical protein